MKKGKPNKKEYSFQQNNTSLYKGLEEVINNNEFILNIILNI
jgi:hypothetical protein